MKVVRKLEEFIKYKTFFDGANYHVGHLKNQTSLFETTVSRIAEKLQKEKHRSEFVQHSVT